MKLKVSILGGITILSGLLSIQPVIGDDIDNEMSVDHQLNSGSTLPTRGISREQVLAQYGEPESKTPAVGSPPISSWNYPDFSVYFEHHLVITSVGVRDQLPIALESIQ